MTIDELKLRREAEAGNRARQLMEAPELVEAFDLLERAYYDAWRTSMPDAVEARERLWNAAVVINKVREHLKETIATGKVADAHIQQLIATPSAMSR